MLHTPKLVRHIIALILLAIAAVLLIIAFEQFPVETTSLAIDWRGLWQGIQGGTLKYGTGVRNPPWSLLVILPLGFLSLRASWGLLTLFILAVLIMSIPVPSGRKVWWLSVILLVTSFPTIRNIADGNFEGLVIAGLLLILHGYYAQNPWTLAGGVLLATAKIQEVWLLLIVLAIYILRTWPLQRWLASGLIMTLVIVPSLLWFGQGWWEEMTDIPQLNTVVNMSLTATLNRLNIPFWLTSTLWLGMLGTTLYVTFRNNDLSISRQKAGFLISASLLLASYSAGNSLLTVLAIGIIPLLPAHPRLGIMLMLFINLPYLYYPYITVSDHLYWLNVYYPTVMLILAWSVFIWLIYHMDTRIKVSTAYEHLTS